MKDAILLLQLVLSNQIIVAKLRQLVQKQNLNAIYY